jgi:hypothetical protein
MAKKFKLTVSVPYELEFEKLPISKHKAIMKEEMEASIVELMKEHFPKACEGAGFKVNLVKLGKIVTNVESLDVSTAKDPKATKAEKVVKVTKEKKVKS